MDRTPQSRSKWAGGSRLDDPPGAAGGAEVGDGSGGSVEYRAARNRRLSSNSTARTSSRTVDDTYLRSAIA